jgi:hypothetical protein
MFKTQPFEDAMFGGIESIIEYYRPHIHNNVTKNADKSRATLNEDDLTQECKVAIVRCWRQQQSLGVKNFDLLVKRAIRNVIITTVGREFCQKRGQCKIEFFSDLVIANENSEGGQLDIENALFHRGQQSYTNNESGLDSVITQIKQHLDEPRLVTTFEHILLNYSPEDLRPQRISQNRKKKIAKELQIPENEVEHNIAEIHFILQGYRENFGHY